MIVQPEPSNIDSLRHVLWREERYLLDDFVSGQTIGHNVVATVCVECGPMTTAAARLQWASWARPNSRLGWGR